MPVGDDGGNLCGAFTPIVLVDMLDDFFAPPCLDVDIDIRRAGTSRLQEAFKKH